MFRYPVQDFSHLDSDIVIREIFPEYPGTVGRGKYCFMKRLVYLAAVNVKCGYDLDILRKIPAEIVMHETDWVFLVMLVVFYPLKKSAGAITDTHNGNLYLPHASSLRVKCLYKLFAIDQFKINEAKPYWA
jgi:hypothetical protein